MRYKVYDESGTIPEEWLKLWEEEHHNGRRKRYSGERVMFTMDVPRRYDDDIHTTFSWLEPDPEYAKPASRVT